MTNSNSKFKWHYLIIASIMLGILASFFVVGAYAEEPTAIDEPLYPVSLGFYPLEYTGGNVDYNGSCYILARYSNYQSWYSTHLYNVGGLLYYETSYYNGTENVSLTRKYDPSTHYLVANFESVGGSSFAPESNTDFFDSYKRSVSAYDIFKVGFSYSTTYPSLSVPDKFGYLVYPESESVWVTEYPFNQFSISNNHLMLSGVDENVSIYYDLSVYAPLYISWHESFSLMGSDDLYVPESLPLFYLYMTPVLADSPIEPQPPVDDDNDSPVIFEPVKTLIFGIFEGLADLEIYPGISLMAIIFGFIGLYLARYLIKLIAGG